MKVYHCINQVMRDMASQGIQKDRKNQQQGYNFRGIDDVYNALSSSMSKHGLVVLPRVMQRECVERTTAKGTALYYVTVEVEFDFVAAEDGSKHTVKTFGEAMDSADKATNKAMSAAYKYAALQAFCIPTEGDNDTENDNQAAHDESMALKKLATERATKLAAEIRACDSVEKLNVLAEVGPTIDGITPALLKRLADLVAERAEALA